MDMINQINKKVLELWQNRFQDDSDVLMPLIYPPIKKGAILFVGLNPSFSLQCFEKILKDTSYSYIKPDDYFHWRNRNKFNLEIAQAIEVLAKKKHPYFKKFQCIAKYTAMDWEHIDLFFYRETKQNNFIEIIKEKGSERLNKFGEDQFNLSKELIALASPKVIVVANAYASVRIREEFNAQFDDKKGYYTTELNGKTIPLFLASMLTGQRAMDNFSYERLKWHIKKAIE